MIAIAKKRGGDAYAEGRLLSYFLAILVVLLPTTSVVAGRAPAAKPFETFEGCVLEPDEWTDGDSFRVRLRDGRLETFRLYFVDTTESRRHSTRSEEQAAYFGITKEAAIVLGAAAKVFTAHALERPFRIQTRWLAVFGPTRYYAIVTTSEGEDLGSLLVSKGLARIYGTRTSLPDGRDSRAYLAMLLGLESRAESQQLGAWKR